MINMTVFMPSSHTQNMDIVHLLVLVACARMYSLEAAFTGACCTTGIQ